MAQPAESSPPPRRKLEIISVEPEADPRVLAHPSTAFPSPIPLPQAAPSPSPTSTATQAQTVFARQAAISGVLQAMALVLAVRLMLLLVLAGAMALAIMAMNDPQPLKLGALGLYAVLVVLPVVWLERTSRRAP